MGCRKGPTPPLRNADRGISGAAAYQEYASLGASRAALHLDLFEQPV